MSDATESWLPVVGWEGLYEVSDQGRVRSLPRQTASGRRGGKILRPRPLPTGYLRAGLYRGSQSQRDAYIHQLVAAAFIGPCPPGEEVKHGPAGKLDNRLVNLSYGPHIENCEDRARDKAGHAKLNRAKAAEIRARVSAGEPRKAIAADFGIALCTISFITTGRCWRPT